MEAYDELASCSEASSDEDSSDYDVLADEDSEVEEEDEEYADFRARRRATISPPDAFSSTICLDGREDSDPLVSSLLRDGGNEIKVTVEQCKDYLRKHGLRVSGTKSVLIERIEGHLKEQESNVAVQCRDSNDSSSLVHENLMDQLKNMELNSKSSTEFPKDVKKMTVEDCKAYLRKHGLRLTGNKQVLIERIEEHLQIKDDQGQSRYPESSFSVDCQGDACVGDVVLFKQKVYDSFNIGGRCSAGPPVGIRTIAGRIVKDSYGATKQQHTFTVEVLWSTGDRPLPPLHPLIIKGRNLYRVKTLRQKWVDETARTKRVQEKHARGAAAQEARRSRLEKMKSYGHFAKKTCKVVAKSDKSCRGNSVTHSLVTGGTAAMLMQNNLRGHNARVNPLNMSVTAACGDRLQPSNGQMADRLYTITTQMTSINREYLSSSSVNSNLNGKVITALPTATNMMLSHSADPAISSVELSFNGTLAGLMIGKKGAHLNEVKCISQADVKIDTSNPDLCIVRITGTVFQRETAARMVCERVSCRSFANTGTCPHRETCKFVHGFSK